MEVLVPPNLDFTLVIHSNHEAVNQERGLNLMEQLAEPSNGPFQQKQALLIRYIFRDSVQSPRYILGDHSYFHRWRSLADGNVLVCNFVDSDD